MDGSCRRNPRVFHCALSAVAALLPVIFLPTLPRVYPFYSMKRISFDTCKLDRPCQIVCSPDAGIRSLCLYLKNLNPQVVARGCIVVIVTSSASAIHFTADLMSTTEEMSRMRIPHESTDTFLDLLRDGRLVRYTNLLSFPAHVSQESQQLASTSFKESLVHSELSELSELGTRSLGPRN